MVLALLQYNPEEEIGSNFGFYGILGKRNTGKTTYCRWLSSYLRSSREGVVIVIVDNSKIRDQWAQFVPKTHIYTADEFMVLEQVQKIQNDVHHSAQLHQLVDQQTDVYKLSVTIILDDVGAHPKVMNSSALKNLAATGRHVHTNTFVLLQHLKQAPPQVRSQFQAVFMLQCSSFDTIKTIHREFVSMVNFEEFKVVLASATQNYGILVINCDSKASMTIQDVCKFAEISNLQHLQTVQLGKRSQWEFCNDNYVDNVTYHDLLLEDHSDYTESTKTRPGGFTVNKIYT